MTKNPYPFLMFTIPLNVFTVTLTENHDCWELSKRTSTLALEFDCKSYEAGEEYPKE